MRWSGASGGQGGGQVASQFLGGPAAWGEEQDGAKIGAQRVADEARPAGAGVGRGLVGQGFQVDFFEGDGAFRVGDERGVAPDASQPGDDILGIGDAAAEEEELCFRRRQGESELVVHAADGVGDHLVFVDDQKTRPAALEKLALLRFQGGDDHLCVEFGGEVAGGNAHVPAPSMPLREFVVGERTGGHGEDGLAFQGRKEELEDVGFPRAGGGVNDDVPALAQRAHGVLLPEVGND